MKWFSFDQHNSLSLWPPICHQGLGTAEWISRNAEPLPLNLLTPCNIRCTVLFLPSTWILSQGPHHTWLKFGFLHVSCSQSDEWIHTSAFHIYTWNTSVLFCIATVFWSQVIFPAASLVHMHISGPRQAMRRPATEPYSGTRTSIVIRHLKCATKTVQACRLQYCIGSQNTYTFNVISESWKETQNLKFQLNTFIPTYLLISSIHLKPCLCLIFFFITCPSALDISLFSKASIFCVQNNNNSKYVDST